MGDRHMLDCAFPYALPKLNSGAAPGLTKKEWYSGMALIGILISGRHQGESAVENAKLYGEMMTK